MKVLVPPKSKAARNLRRLSPAARRERLRCAGAVLELAKWCEQFHPDEPAQWLRLEQAFKDILVDNCARVDWVPTEPEKKRRPRGGGRAR